MRLWLTLLVCVGFFYQQLSGQENFILIDGSTSEIINEFGPSLKERVTPACSFNIVLSLMGYDVGVLQDEQTPVWEFQEGYDDFSESWKASQTPKTWMSRSCVWFSKIISLQLGSETIQRYLALFEYGNQDLSGGLAEPGPIKSAWLSSSLKISPKEQVDFIQKMIQKKLPVLSNTLEMTKRLLFKEELAQGWNLFGKTGLGTSLGLNGKNLKVRWFVGWVETDHNFFPFAYQLQENEIDILRTVPRVKQLLEESNLLNLIE